MELDPFREPYKWLTCYACLLPRLLVMFSVMPMFSRQALPGLLRTGIAGGLGVFLVPTMIDQMQVFERGAIETLLATVKEAVLGLALGFFMAVPLWALEAMGAFVDSQRGASIASTISPLTGHDSSPLGELFTQAAVVFLFASGGFHALLSATYGSFLLWPVFDWWPRFSAETPQLLLAQLDRLTHFAMLMGAPVVIAMFMAEMGLAVVSRFAPQLQVFFLAMPVKSGIAMFVFAVYGTTLFDYSRDALLDMDAALQSIGAMTGRVQR
jgi:type III secretion protein T